MAGFYEEALGRASFKLDCTEFLKIKDFEKRELVVVEPCLQGGTSCIL